ncbi:sigma-54-dependent transcriptional regulator [Mucilaginibacter arboris]|uniref:Response regulator n=1 Tax=Mucilaginibacter arboris TaxID=2682090 RepID=A0A7K1SS33_9SPHI|nr:sigma-54 dependent transcriptional regulator [Mucilaginibacter arboris]MVN20132.1 response regulator [Mucilaginibacter arboris]
MKKLLIIDDEINTANLLSRFLTRNGFEVMTAASGSAAAELLKNYSFTLVLCDFRLEDTDGREVLKKIKQQYPETGVIIITGYSDIKMAVELIKMGAYDYITKPLYPDEILNTINKAIETQSALAAAPPENIYQNPEKNTDKTSFKPTLGKGDLVTGTSEASKELARQINLVSPTNYSVIIFGESGTGKESVAKSIHQNSDRYDKPFIAMDCGSLTKELAGSEFFGHEKGSFTGALNTKIGHFEMANGGTLFLDEIGNLSYEIQATLLRTVQERKVKRIGSTKEIDLDVRIIVATNENLIEAIQKGHFREDLYHRFNEFAIYMPALRNRGADIMLIATHFAKITSQELGKNITRFSADATTALTNYSWPGNIRELKNVIRRATLLTEGEEILTKSLPLEIYSNYIKTPVNEVLPEYKQQVVNPPKPDLKNAALEAEYETILRVLKEVNFNKTKAAQILNIDRKTLYNKMNAADHQQTIKV